MRQETAGTRLTFKMTFPGKGHRLMGAVNKPASAPRTSRLTFSLENGKEGRSEKNVWQAEEWPRPGKGSVGINAPKCQEKRLRDN